MSRSKLPVASVVFADAPFQEAELVPMAIEMTQKSPKMGGVSVGVGVGARDAEELDASNQRHFRYVERDTPDSEEIRLDEAIIDLGTQGQNRGAIGQQFGMNERLIDFLHQNKIPIAVKTSITKDREQAWRHSRSSGNTPAQDL